MGQPAQVSERERLQYLEAMGITPHVARFRLPNAAPTPACDWPEEAPAEEAEADHGTRLHALIDDARDTAGTEAASPPPRATGAPRSARALLEESPAAPSADAATPVPSEPATPVAEDERPAPAEPAAVGEATSASADAEPLRFTLQVAALDGRWLIMLSQTEAPSSDQCRLLGNIFHAAGVRPEHPLDFQLFQWPMMEGLPVEDPLTEAREGLRAFIAGRRSRGWLIERVLLFGTPPALSRALQLGDEQAALLDVPYWQGPDPASLEDARVRRALWQQMQPWSRWWQEGGETASGTAPESGT
ncbi:hypothetical protein C7446_1695 [Kushneria sinocarnis]|uniref:Uncharacterized protein n=1 Tax=Kushneria sinocarnis TaxID=595502 RepID=A0A420WXM0_9GAMM|nr:hypothetical protein [Kushneria sinocarnis]RKR04486.1 hypothetical protein C7446_1695 [Kushneria sinocarnis]